MRTIAKIDGIVIKYNPELSEYIVQVSGKPETAYFTDDKTDAMRTAQVMRTELLNEPR